MQKIHVVEEGEYLTLIARKHGFVTTKPLIDANAELFAKRRDPDVLNPGDEIVIPPKEPVRESRATGQTHEFKLKGHQDHLRLQLRDADGEAIANQPFTLRVQASKSAPADGGLPITGTSDGEGNIDVPLPPGAVKAYLVLDQIPGLHWELAIGGLDPTHDPADDEKTFLKGVQARLNNLGYRCGKVDGELGPRTKAAIARFQRKHMKRHDADGELDASTRDAIQKAHGA
jgi:hypothetical protein